MDDSQKIMKDLTLILLYLSSWNEGDSSQPLHRSWKGYDFHILDDLTDEKLLFDSRRAKSVCLTNSGVEHAKELLVEYGLDIK